MFGLEIKNERNKYEQIIVTMDKNVPYCLIFLLILKSDLTDNLPYFIFSYIFRFIGILIKCSSFILNEEELKSHKNLANHLRFFTSYNIVKILNFNNNAYACLSFIILTLFLIHFSFYFIEYYKIKNNGKEKGYRPFRCRIFMDHFSFLILPFLLEYLGFIFFIMMYPDEFIIKRDKSLNKLNYFLLAINGILIILYNINGFLYMVLINRPFSDRYTPIRYKYTKLKFTFIYILQAFIIIECLPLYLKNNSLKFYEIIPSVFIIIIASSLYFLSIHKYNYNNCINIMVNIVSSFCFFSILIEIIIYLFNYNYNYYNNFFFVTINKLLLSLTFNCIDYIFSYKTMVKMSMSIIFKQKRKKNEKNIYDVFLFLFEAMKNLKNSLLKDRIKKNELVEIILLHREECKSPNCMCRLIKVIPY